MISLTRLNGQRFAVNPDLIQRVEQTPDTIVTLIDGTKLLVEEGLEDVIRIVDDYRAAMVAKSIEMVSTGELEQVRGTAAPIPLRQTGSSRRRGHLTVQPEVD